MQKNNEVSPIPEIWLSNAIITHTGRKLRLEEGLEVYVDNEGKLQDNAEEWNATVTSCHGTINSEQLSIVVMKKDLSLLKIEL